MPFITVQMYPGRTHEQKQALVAKITDAMVETCDATREGVWVVIDEVEPAHWAVGGKLRSAPEKNPE